MAKLSGLEPKIVWSIFEEITKIPRCSGRERNLQSWVKKWADANGVLFKGDDVGNILLTKNPRPGYEGYPTLVYQVHQDMVCEKESDSKHDFEKDPIAIRIEGGYVMAEDTTLGADNGIGIALAMASLIDPETSKYGKIEVLMTVEEETSFRGASNVKKGFFTGKRMVNLDSEEAGVIIIESAGGGSTQYQIKTALKNAKGWRGYRVSIDGLLGGHSGVDIHLNRANAIKLVAGLLSRLSRSLPVRIAHIEGGTVANAIPRTAHCDFMIQPDKVNHAKEITAAWLEEAKKKYPGEKDLKLELIDARLEQALSEEVTGSITKLIEEIPQGVTAWSRNIEGLVQTSNNLGIVRTREDEVAVTLLSRSSDAYDLEKLRVRLRKIGEKNGATTTQPKPSSGWSIDPGSPFVRFIAEEYETIIGREPKVTGIHGGLECSLFSKLDPEIQIVSIGATLESPHSPRERLEISSVSPVWGLIQRMIRDVKEKEA